jgi:hypothetical protein
MLVAMLQVFRAPAVVPPNTVRKRSSRLCLPLMVRAVPLVLFALTLLAPTTRTQPVSMEWLALVPLFDTSGFGSYAGQQPLSGIGCWPFESFVVPAGKTCTRLWYAVAAQRCFNRNNADNSGNPPANPSAIMIALFPNNATTNAPDVSSAPFKWYNFSQPNGTWANMTDELAAGFTCTHARDTDWYELDLTAAPSGSLGAGRHWVTIQPYYIDTTGASVNGYASSSFPGNDYIFHFGPNVYAPSIPSHTVVGGYSQPPVMGPTNYPIGLSTTCGVFGKGAPQVTNFDMMYAVYAYCTANASDPMLSPLQVPPPTCYLKPGDNCLATGCAWTCPSVDFLLNGTSAVATTPANPPSAPLPSTTRALSTPTATPSGVPTPSATAAAVSVALAPMLVAAFSIIA